MGLIPVQEHHYALALVIMHQEEPQNRNERRYQHYCDANQTPAKAREEQYKQTGKRNED